MNYITEILYWISTGLMVPVIVLLIMLFIKSLLQIGSFFGIYLNVRRTEARTRMEFDNLSTSNVDTLEERLPLDGQDLVFQYIRRMLSHKGDKAQMQRILSEFEIAADRQLASSKNLTKLGPMLGLMGTLIPMGPALLGLAQGDIASMAYNMQVAFSTTVVGLFTGAIGFYTGQVRQRWYLQDMAYLECLMEIASQDNKGQES